MKGYRKILIYAMSLLAFVGCLYLQDITDAGAIVAVGSQIVLMLGAAIYGNVKEHESNNK